MEFGRKYRIGGFHVFKHNRVLGKKQVSELRNQLGIPEDMRKYLQRSQLPYIKVETISGMWSVDFCCNTSIYHLLDGLVGEGGDRNETILAHMFNMWFMDTCIPGDEQYVSAKAEALDAFMKRQRAKEVSDEEDDKELESLRQESEAKAKIIEMSNELKKGADDEGDGEDS